MKLYNYWRSSSSWRVRIALAHKEIPYTYEVVNLLAGEQHSDAQRARSPHGKVPVLEVDGRFITESMAIMEWLDETHPTPPLWPSDPFLRARARMVAELVNSGIQPFQNSVVQAYLRDHAIDADAWNARWISGGLVGLERAVAETAGTFAVGDAVSIADLCIVPQLGWAKRMKLDLSALPTLNRIDATCAALPAFIAGHPQSQPDAPPA